MTFKVFARLSLLFHLCYSQSIPLSKIATDSFVRLRVDGSLWQPFYTHTSSDYTVHACGAIATILKADAFSLTNGNCSVSTNILSLVGSGANTLDVYIVNEKTNIMKQVYFVIDQNDKAIYQAYRFNPGEAFEACKLAIDPFPGTPQSTSLFLHDGNIFAFGGDVVDKWVKKLNSDGSWNPFYGQMQNGRKKAQATKIGSSKFIVAGFDSFDTTFPGAACLSSTEIFDFTTATSYYGPSLPYGVGNYPMLLALNATHILMYGGFNCIASTVAWDSTVMINLDTNTSQIISHNTVNGIRLAAKFIMFPHPISKKMVPTLIGGARVGFLTFILPFEFFDLDTFQWEGAPGEFPGYEVPEVNAYLDLSLGLDLPGYLFLVHAGQNQAFIWHEAEWTELQAPINSFIGAFGVMVDEDIVCKK